MRALLRPAIIRMGGFGSPQVAVAVAIVSSTADEWARSNAQRKRFANCSTKPDFNRLACVPGVWAWCMRPVVVALPLEVPRLVVEGDRLVTADQRQVVVDHATGVAGVRLAMDFAHGLLVADRATGDSAGGSGA